MALIVILGMVAYSNAFDVPFVFDDEPNILENSRIRDISNIPSMFVELKGPFASRPLMHATFALNYSLHGLNVEGYHAVNLAIHLLNGTLLYLLVLVTGRLMNYGEKESGLVGAVSAMLFVLHPMQTEAVTYVVSRSMLLATLFFLCGILLFARAVTSERRRGFFIAGLLIVSLMGAASRENFAVFPIVLFLYDLFFISKFRLRSVAGHYKAYLPVVLSLAYIAYLGFNNTYDRSWDYIGDRVPHSQYVLTQFNVHWTYLRLFALPVGQSIDYDYPVAETLFEYPTLLSFLGYAVLLVGSILYAKRRPVISFSILWFLIALAPISFLVAVLDLRLGDVLLEHRFYLPGVGVIVAIVCSVAYFLRGLSGERIRMTITVFVLAVPIVLGIAAYARNTVWSSNINLWAEVVEKYPGKWRGHFNLANSYQRAGFVEEAKEGYLAAVRMKPEYWKAHYGLGLCYKVLGDMDKALEHSLIARSLKPDYADTHTNIGNIYLVIGEVDKAIKSYVTAASLKPDSVDTHYNLGVGYYYKGLTDKAIEQYIIAIGLDPDDADVHSNLGAAYLKKGLRELARQEFEKALRIDPDHYEARKSLGAIMLSPSPRM